MPRYTVVTDEIYLVGRGWYKQTIAHKLRLNRYDMEDLLAQREGEREIGRESVQLYIDTHSGGFQVVTDFAADFGSLNLKFAWATDESECTFQDCMYPATDSYKEE